MNICGWEYIGLYRWWAELPPESRPNWVSAIGTVLAALIALSVFLAGTWEARRRDRRVTTQAMADLRLRQSALAAMIIGDLWIATQRVANAMLFLIRNKAGNVTDYTHFCSEYYCGELAALAPLKVEMMILDPKLCVGVASAMAQLALYNSHVESMRIENQRSREAASRPGAAGFAMRMAPVQADALARLFAIGYNAVELVEKVGPSIVELLPDNSIFGQPTKFAELRAQFRSQRLADCDVPGARPET